MIRELIINNIVEKYLSRFQILMDFSGTCMYVFQYAETDMVFYRIRGFEKRDCLLHNRLTVYKGTIINIIMVEIIKEII